MAPFLEKVYAIASLDELTRVSRYVRKLRALSTETTVPRPLLNLKGHSKNISALKARAAQPMHVPEAIEYEVQYPIVVDQGLVLTRDGFAVRESLRDVPPGERGASVVADTTVTLKKEPKHVPYTGLLLKKQGQTNFGHWLVELLPIQHVCREPSVLVHRPSKGFEFLSELYESSLQAVAPGTTISAMDATPAELPSLNYVAGMSDLRSFFSPAVASMAQAMRPRVPASRRRIFVTRTKSHARGIENDSEVYDYFLQRGFEIIEPSSMSLADQIATFATAGCVFGIMGAAMCNSIFSPPSARIGYIASEHMASRFYLDMEAALGRKSLNVMYCPAKMNSGTLDALHRNIVVGMYELDEFYRSVME